MISGISNSVSALMAYGKKFEAAANNTANMDTDGYKSARVTLEEGVNGGVQALMDTVSTPGHLVQEPASAGIMLVEKSNVDLAAEVTNQVLAARSYEANLASIKAYDEMLGSVLDIVK